MEHPVGTFRFASFVMICVRKLIVLDFFSAGWMVFPALTPDFKRAVLGGGFSDPSNVQYEEEEIGSMPVEK